MRKILYHHVKDSHFRRHRGQIGRNKLRTEARTTVSERSSLTNMKNLLAEIRLVFQTS